VGWFRSDVLRTNSIKVVQNVVVELQYRGAAQSATGRSSSTTQQAIYVGWTGMTSRRAPYSTERAGANKEVDTGVVEIDVSFARMIGLVEGQKVCMFPIKANDSPPSLKLFRLV
jgi:peroxin-1